MKVLRIIARLNVGGPARHVVSLDRGLRARGHETLLVHGAVDEGEASLEHLTTECGVPTLRIEELGRRVKLWSDARAFVRLARVIFREQPDVVHTHTAKAGALGRLAAAGYNATRARRRRAVVVHTFHGHVLQGYFSRAGTTTVRAVERLLARFTDRIVTISPSQYDDIVQRYRVGSSDRTVVVPLGLELDFLRGNLSGRSLRPELGIREGAIVFGYVGRLVPIKDVPTLVRAFVRVVQALPDAHLLIVGDGPARPEIEALVDASALHLRVRLLGWREDLDRIYGTIDVGVISSRNEGTPVALIEAMAAGRPVVATRVGGVPDVVAHDETGLLVPPGDVEALSGAMIRLGRDAECRSRLGTRARAASTRFRQERLVEDIENLYRDALVAKRS